jgi:hydroxypyruvate isomerase
MMNRREFLGVGTACALSLAGGAAMSGGTLLPGRRFSRHFAPHLGTFRQHAGSDAIDQIKFLADQGFTAVEDMGLRGKPAVLQMRIGEELARRGLAMGLFVGVADFGQPTFASGRADLRRDVIRDLDRAIDTARRVGGRYLSIVPGKSAANATMKAQMRKAIDTLQFCADRCEASGLVMLLEPIDHGPGASRLFLRSAVQAARLCRAVGRPSCRFLFDVYQQAVSGADLPRLLTATQDVLGYVQLADFPGRKEPGTGEIDFRALFSTLDAIGYAGILGMEHGNSLPGCEGERAVVEAYATLERRLYRRSASAAADLHASTSLWVRSKTSIE